jgi:hypothetical protein
MSNNYQDFQQGQVLRADELNDLQDNTIIHVDTLNNVPNVPSGVNFVYVADDGNIFIRDARSTNYPNGWKKITTTEDDHPAVHYINYGRPDDPLLYGPIGSTFSCVDPENNQGALRWVRVDDTNNGWKCIDGSAGPFGLAEPGILSVSAIRYGPMLHVFFQAELVSGDGHATIDLGEMFNLKHFAVAPLSFVNYYPYPGIDATSVYSDSSGYVLQDWPAQTGKQGLFMGTLYGEALNHAWPANTNNPFSIEDAIAKVKDAAKTVESRSEGFEKLVPKDQTRDQFLKACASQIKFFEGFLS